MTPALSDWPGLDAGSLLWLDDASPRHALALELQRAHHTALAVVFDELRRRRDAKAEPGGAAPDDVTGYTEAVHANRACQDLRDRLMAQGWEPAPLVGAWRDDGSARWALAPARPMAVEAARRRLAERGVPIDAPPPPAAIVTSRPVTAPAIQGSLF